MGATIMDVARYAGLSIGTVSKYINHKPVSPKNQQRIAEAIEKLDYQINDFARGLRTATSMMIGLLVPGIVNIFTTSLIKAMEETLVHSNYSMILCNYDYSTDNLAQKLSFMRQKKVDGVILLVGGNVDEKIKGIISDMQRAGTVFVFVNGEVEDIRANTVIVDTVSTIYDSVGLLIAQGHRRIGLFSAPKNTWNAREREEGYRRVFADYHLPVDERFLCLYGEDNTWQLTLKECCEAFLRANEDTTAIVLPGYRLTLAGVHAIHRLGRKIGKDISVIGFDCGQINDVLDPVLTYVCLPAEEMAHSAVSLLLATLNHAETEPRIIRAKARILPGDSIQPPI